MDWRYGCVGVLGRDGSPVGATLEELDSNVDALVLTLEAPGADTRIPTELLTDGWEGTSRHHRDRSNTLVTLARLTAV